MDSPIVTLTTDWGTRDFFVGMVKGRLCSLIPGVRVFDLSHCQERGDIAVTASIIRQGCLSFPEGSIHLVDVGDSRNQKGFQRPVLAECNGHYVISTELRIVEMALGSQASQVVWLQPSEEAPSWTFLASDLMCVAAARLTQGVRVEEMGTVCSEYRERRFPEPPYDDRHIRAMVTTVDRYGNANLNVSYEMFERLRAGRAFRLELSGNFTAHSHDRAITELHRHYSDVDPGNLLLTVSASGFLQLALNQASASQLLGLRQTAACEIVFF